MMFPAYPNANIKRFELVAEAISGIVAELAAEDSEAAHEESGGGLRTITFAGGYANDLEDLNPANLSERWSSIR